ncbi:SRPBCC family protein [Nocardioides sp. TRM66260-LWL]|uniref:SRPBCC family protein n=1 Tax=Nocardioides sp. TRM66260-LWL TaxID=2874478 RepID=UPI001CC5A1D1|nr:SRPBCC family protein [Nocardioides sp. TRM66260-LWL]MBZ5734817.1 SRPBCC family protein [Nocardioides sp. TRM66260-LWL]
MSRATGPDGVEAVRFPVPTHVACAYLADPRNRASWQSSLRRVDDVRGEVGVGQTWVDVTVPGLRPRMETTALDAPVDGGPGSWTEIGRMGPYSAELTLDFAPDPDAPGGCLVAPRFVIRGPLGFVLNRIAPGTVRADLRRAARLVDAAHG